VVFGDGFSEELFPFVYQPRLIHLFPEMKGIQQFLDHFDVGLIVLALHR
jgi:hypothetical protein